ncbi:hypothetical protein C8A01DRAFT_17466 [Parachaetomium inaequale]|uniref:Pentatricopeptide repeat domain-containing protein n=1 Tax=Parachaetomium inaequale TaxID=2588326 RepID=A0AAN6SQL2_9PEZI|nr:hypothetical protein C8A01DRAFT_17466 [Parachaetomium inaequale]
MTLGSALPWRACSPLGRIQHQHRRRLGLAALENPRTVRHGAHFRALSTGTGTDATKPAKPSAENSAAAASLSSLIDRLRRIPVQPHGDNESVLVKPVTPYPHPREDHEALQKHHRALTQQLRLENYLEHHRGGDWRAILQNLIKWTPTQTRRQDLKVIIPRHSAALLSTDHERNLWNIRSRTGCDMALCRPTDEGAHMDPYVILSGQPTAISAAVDDILKTTKGVTVVNMQGPPQMGLHGDQTGVDGSAVTRTIIRPHQMSVPCRSYELKTRADGIPRPSEWTAEAFQQYTAALVKGHMPASRARRLYPRGVTHKDAVMRQLHAVFNDPAASAAVSLPALKLVLRHLAAAGETHINDSRALIERVETLGLRMDTGIYNLLAETAVYAKHMLAFECTLSRMIIHGHRPNIRTWLLFLRLVESEEIRRYILQAMDTKNFFWDPATVIRVSEIMADHDAYRAVQQGQDWDAFLAGLRELYGPEWRLHERAATKYLDVFGRYSKFDDMRRLLEYMFSSSHARPNAVSLNTIITHCKHQQKVGLAVAFVRMFDERGYSVANRITLHLLFKLARKKRKPHLLSAVWRYAHRRDMTDYDMRDLGIRLLAGRHELSQLIDRIRGLWEEPHNCKISKQEFIENLLLCDYQVGQTASSNAQPLATSGRTTTKKPPRDPPDDATAAPGEETALQQQQARSSMSAAEMYDLYAKAMSKKAEEWAPAMPLGAFLQAALDCDRGLHKLREERPEAYNGLPVDMHPVELPIAKRGAGVTNAMLRWLADKKMKERAAGVVPDSEDQESVIDVMGESEDDDGESGRRTVGRAKTDEATAANGGAIIDQPPTENVREVNGAWNSLLRVMKATKKKKAHA